MKRGFNFSYFLSEGFHSIFSHGLMSFAAVCMIVACLIIMGSFSLLAVNADRWLSDAEDQNEFLAFIDEEFPDEQIPGLIHKVEALPNVASVTYTTREEAKASYTAKYGSEGLYGQLPDDVFRDRLEIYVRDLELFSDTVDQVKVMDGVADYNAETGLAAGFVAVRNAATALATVLVVILAAVSLFIISNTIRLAAFTRREEIAIMKMCGATDSFVRWPFIFEGLLLGLAGALLAFLLQWGIYNLVLEAMENSGAAALFPPIPFARIWASVLPAFLLAGAAIGAVGSSFAIRRFLRV